MGKYQANETKLQKTTGTITNRNMIVQPKVKEQGKGEANNVFNV